MRNSERGNANVPIIVLVILWLISCGLCWYSFDNGSTQKKQLERSDKKLIAAEKTLRQTQEQLYKVCNLTGFYPQPDKNANMRENPEMVVASPKAIKQRIDAICTNSSLQLNLNPQEINFDDLYSPDNIRNLQKLETIWERCSERIKALQDKLNSIQNQLQQEQLQYNSEAQKTKSAIASLEDEIQKQRQDLETARRKNDEKLQQEEEKRANLQKNKLEVKEKVAKLFRERRAQTEKYENELQNLKERIHELKVAAAGETEIERLYKEETETQGLQELPDGEIIHVNIQNQTAFINLGRADGILKGQSFRVFRYGKGGTKKYKGTVMVKKVDKNISMVGIIEETDPLNLIVTGDQIINPVYDRDKVRYFVIAGTLAQYSNNQAGRLVAKLGGKLEKDVSAKTDFVILGEDFKKDPIYQTAQERGIEMMLESEFMGYVGE